MIAGTNINLKVPFNEKDQAKSLGARWNAEAKLWYVPQGVDVAPFKKWVSSASNSEPNLATATAPAKPSVNPMSQNKPPFNEDLDTINASLRNAYESPEDAI